MNGPFDPAVHLTIADLQVDSLTNLQSFKVFIKCAKTNSFWQGCFIFLGCGSTSLCCWLYQTTFTFEGQVKVSHFLSRWLSSFRGLSIFILAIYTTGSRHSQKVLCRSFKIGVATTAAQQGTSDHLIKTMGCWSSEAYLLYVCTPVDSILSVAEQIT